MNETKDAATTESWAAPGTSVTRRQPYSFATLPTTTQVPGALISQRGASGIPVAHGPRGLYSELQTTLEGCALCTAHRGPSRFGQCRTHPIMSTQMGSNRRTRGRGAHLCESGDAFAATNRATLHLPKPTIALSHAASKRYSEQQRQAKVSTRIRLLWLLQGLRLVLMTTMLQPKSHPASHMIIGV